MFPTQLISACYFYLTQIYYATINSEILVWAKGKGYGQEMCKHKMSNGSRVICSRNKLL